MEKPRPYYCSIHKTTTPGHCVICLALAASPRVFPLPDGTLDLDLHVEDAEREAEIRGQSMGETLDVNPCRKQTRR